MKLHNSQLSLGVWAFVKNAFTVNFIINSQNKPLHRYGTPISTTFHIRGYLGDLACIFEKKNGLYLYQGQIINLAFRSPTNLAAE